MHIKENPTHPALTSKAVKVSAVLFSAWMCLEPMLAFAKGRTISYMGNDPDICGRNPKTGKPNMCIKEIPIKEYLETHPGAADFYRPARTTSMTAEQLQETIRRARRSTPKIGKTYSPEEVQKMQELMKNWSDKDIENLAVILYPELTDEEMKILIGAAKKCTWDFINSHAARIGLDSMIALTVVIAESRLWQESGDSGKAKTPMQILSDPTDPKNDTAGLMYGRYGKDDPFIKALGDNWRNDRNALMILALYYLRDAVKEAGCEGIPFEKLTAKQLIAIYHSYNKGHKYNGETTEQQGNFAKSMKYLKLYPKMEAFLDQVLERVNPVLLAQYTKKAMEAVDAKKAKKPEKKPPTKAQQEHEKMMKDHAESVAAFHASTMTAKPILSPSAASQQEASKKAEKASWLAGLASGAKQKCNGWYDAYRRWYAKREHEKVQKAIEARKQTEAEEERRKEAARVAAVAQAQRQAQQPAPQPATETRKSGQERPAEQPPQAGRAEKPPAKKESPIKQEPQPAPATTAAIQALTTTVKTPDVLKVPETSTSTVLASASSGDGKAAQPAPKQKPLIEAPITKEESVKSKDTEKKEQAPAEAKEARPEQQPTSAKATSVAPTGGKPKISSAREKLQAEVDRLKEKRAEHEKRLAELRAELERMSKR